MQKLTRRQRQWIDSRQKARKAAKHIRSIEPDSGNISRLLRGYVLSGGNRLLCKVKPL